MATRRLEGKPVAEALLAATKTLAVRSPGAHGGPPTLASVHRGGSTAFQVYLRQQIRTGEQAGIVVRPEELAPGADAAALHHHLERLDRDAGVDAVLVEHPLPPELRFADAVRALRPEKDVDGVGALNVGLLVSGAPVQTPAVALAAVAIADHYAIPLAHRRVTVVGRSPTVGLPLALMLLAKGRDATVTIAHSATGDLASALRGSDVIFSCAGAPRLLGRGNVPEGAAVIDVGLSRTPDASAPSGSRMAGDADAAALDGWASALSPVPGGVGPVTVAEIMANTVRARRLLTGEPGR